MVFRWMSILAVWFVALSAADYVYAQEGGPAPGAPSSAWLGMGLGYGGAGAGLTTEAGGFLAINLSGRVELDRIALSARISETSGGPSPYRVFIFPLRDSFQETAVLVGYIVPLGDSWQVTGSTGLARITGYRAIRLSCPKFCLATGTTEPFAPRLGLPVELEVSFLFRRMQRIRLVGYANLNGEEVFGGVLLSVSGRLW